jgi:hypothetical protein
MSGSLYAYAKTTVYVGQLPMAKAFSTSPVVVEGNSGDFPVRFTKAKRSHVTCVQITDQAAWKPLF